jgi:hypothetical protein
MFGYDRLVEGVFLAWERLSTYRRVKVQNYGGSKAGLLK